MSPSSRALSALLAIALATQPACQMSTNHRRGLTLLGGAGVFIGGIIAVDGVYCDDSATGASDCNEDSSDLAAGVALLGLGGAVMAFALLSKSKE